MKELDVNELINFNNRILILLGIATSIIGNIKSSHLNPDVKWWMQAINDVIYLNKPLPLRPEKEF